MPQTDAAIKDCQQIHHLVSAAESHGSLELRVRLTDDSEHVITLEPDGHGGVKARPGRPAGTGAAWVP